VTFKPSRREVLRAGATTGLGAALGAGSLISALTASADSTPSPTTAASPSTDQLPPTSTGLPLPPVAGIAVGAALVAAGWWSRRRARGRATPAG
jgi:hypothetical protein